MLKLWITFNLSTQLLVPVLRDTYMHIEALST